MSMMSQLQQLLVDKYTAQELVEKLSASVDAETIVDVFGEEILFEFCEGGEFEDEFFMLMGDDDELN